MKTKIFIPVLFLLGGLTSLPAFAEEIARPTPAPVVSAAPDQDLVNEPAVIDHVVYLAKLPSPDELIKGAELKATPILRMDQTGDRIVVVYQYAGGRTVTFAYSLLSNAGSSRPSAAPQASSSDYRVITPTPAPTTATTTVVYAEPPPPQVVYYSPRYRSYDPAWDFWAPFTLGVGLGWVGGHGHGYGGWHGGYHRGGGWHR